MRERYAHTLTYRRRVPSIAVVAYPVLAPDDARWIEAVRAAHDPNHQRLRAHVTLVFPVEAAGLEAHVAAIAASVAPIRFVLREVRAVRDHATGAGGHVFLVPDEGAAAITALHDRLYTGPLAPHLRADLPFIPHVTIAANRDFGACERLAAQLRVEIRGELHAIDVLELGAGDVRTLARYPLT